MLIWGEKNSVEKGNALYLARGHAGATSHLASLKRDETPVLVEEDMHPRVQNPRAPGSM